MLGFGGKRRCQASCLRWTSCFYERSSLLQPKTDARHQWGQEWLPWPHSTSLSLGPLICRTGTATVPTSLVVARLAGNAVYVTWRSR